LRLEKVELSRHENFSKRQVLSRGIAQDEVRERIFRESFPEMCDTCKNYVFLPKACLKVGRAEDFRAKKVENL